MTINDYFNPVPCRNWQRTIEKVYFIEVNEDVEKSAESIDSAYLLRAYRLFLVFSDSIHPLELDVFYSNLGYILGRYHSRESWGETLKWATQLDKYECCKISDVLAIVHPEAQLYEDSSEEGILSILLTFHCGSKLQIITADLNDDTLHLGGDELFAFNHEHYSLADVRKLYPEAYLLK